MRVPKFVFNCQRTGMCCETRDSIDVHIEDLERWWTDGSFARVYPELKVVTDGGVPLRMEIQKKDTCQFLDGKDCSIYDARPISCRAFPLGFNGKSFVRVDEECSGTGKGEMTAESLEEIRDAAKAEYHARVRTAAILPALHAIILKDTMAQSEEALGKLSDEDREKLKKIFSDAK
ncbi:MAG: YkgJ family cysteine cluster protein [Candidatus Hydrothermarchaeaceae archaeon]